MHVARTPDERFADLSGFPFDPHYVEIPDGARGTLRVHYVDEGPASADPVLLMHGEPSWSYLYRKMIPLLIADGHRCVVPDLVGFGRSDKPTEQQDYTYGRHVEWMAQVLFGELDLRTITFFGQDWGGLIGLRLVAQDPDRFARVAIGNTGLPTGDQRMSEAFLSWQRFARESAGFDIGRIVNNGSATSLSDAEIAAYDAPFPDESFKAGARIFPSLVPTRPDDPAAEDNRRAWQVLQGFDRPFLCTFSDGDPMTAGADRPFLKLVPGAGGQPHATIGGAGHFLQEDAGPELARILVDFIGAG
jgi:haloalkane dehalogenase